MLNLIVFNRTDYLHKKMDLALNNLQRLICYKTQQTNQTKPFNCVQAGGLCLIWNII